jgi:Phosphotransferase enzyme family
MPVTVPRGPEDLTADWVTAALRDVSEGARATDLTAVRIGKGNVADSVRLVPVWDRPTSAPASVVAKVPSSAVVSRAAGFSTRTYEIEAAFYNDLAGSLRVNRPYCYLARYAPEQEAYVVLMEDLTPAEAGDQVAGCDPADAAAVMPELAALHAPRWGDRSLLDIDWLDRPDPARVRGMAEVVPLLFAGFVERYEPRVDPEVLDLSRHLMDRLEAYLLDRPEPWTVVHGDFRLDNLLFGGARVVVVDWQTVRIGPPLSDVAYFIGSALVEAERGQHERALVKAYHQHLRDAGVDVAFEECWNGYRRYAFDGLVMGIAASMLVTQTPRSDDMFMAMVNRHGHQALDLGSADFLTG